MKRIPQTLIAILITSMLAIPVKADLIRNPVSMLGLNFSAFVEAGGYAGSSEIDATALLTRLGILRESPNFKHDFTLTVIYTSLEGRDSFHLSSLSFSHYKLSPKWLLSNKRRHIMDDAWVYDRDSTFSLGTTYQMESENLTFRQFAGIGYRILNATSSNDDAALDLSSALHIPFNEVFVLEQALQLEQNFDGPAFIEYNIAGVWRITDFVALRSNFTARHITAAFNNRSDSSRLFTFSAVAYF